MANRHLSLGRARGLRLLGVVALVAVIAAVLVVTAWARHDLPPLQSGHPSTTSTADAPYQICRVGHDVDQMWTRESESAAARMAVTL
jgi:hypothetical protein